MDNQQGSIVWHRNSAQCHAAAWMGQEFGGEWIHMHVWVSPSPVYLKLSQRCESAIPQYKIKSSRKKGVLSSNAHLDTICRTSMLERVLVV